MDEDRPLAKQRCKAMIDAGVYDPESLEGILFCAGSRDDSVKSQCPYEYCVVLEYKETAVQLKGKEKADLARELKEHKVSVDDIALILDKSVRQVNRYLKK